MATRINYTEFQQLVNWDEYYAMVYDCANNRYNYVGGEMSEELMDVIYKADNEGGIWIEPMHEADERAVEVMRDNMLTEFEPAAGVEDEGYEAMKRMFADNAGRIVTINVRDNESLYILIPD